jgi:hypothetical protein
VLVSASSLFCAFLFLKYDWTCISLRENYFCTFFYLIKSGLKAYPLFPTEGTHGGPPEVRHIDGEAAGCPARVMVLESRSRFWHMATFFFFSFMCLKVTLFALHVSTSQIDVDFMTTQTRIPEVVLSVSPVVHCSFYVSLNIFKNGSARL